MARSVAWLACVVSAALVVGCEPAKELPTDVVKHDGPAKGPAVPAKSDPEAKAVVDKAVLALTGGKPELLAKGKYSSCVVKGQMFSAEQQNQSVEASGTVTAAWPDKLKFTNESMRFGNKLLVESWLRRPDLVVYNNGALSQYGNSPEAEQNLANYAVGQHWMVFLLPPTDPKAVVFGLQTISFEKRELNVVKLALGEYPLYTLTFDTANRLVRSEYTGTEIGVTRRTTAVYSDFKPGPEGLTLPFAIECRHNGNTVEKWAVEKWELPATIKDDEFSPPKRK